MTLDGRGGAGTVLAAPVLADVGPLAQLRTGSLRRRLPQLFLGLGLFGVAHGLMYRAGLGLPPWDVLHVGLSHRLPISIGQALILVAIAVMAAWIPLREKPGIGTVANAVLIGLAIDATISRVGRPAHLLGRVAMLGGGLVLCAFAGAMYIGAQLGRGPRDGLMTGLHRRTGLSIRVVRTCLEGVVLVVGLLMGGSVGLGTVTFALGIGPLTQALLPFWMVEASADPGRAEIA